MTQLETLLPLLDRWERRTDHDLGADLILSQAWLQLFSDGSGRVVAQLNARAATGDRGLDNLFTAVGLEAQMEKPFPFENCDEARRILSRPIKLEYSR